MISGLWHYGRQNNIDWSPSGLWRLFQSWPILLFGWTLAVCLGLFAFMLRTPAAQGRLLFPALLPVALLVGFGVDQAITSASQSGSTLIGIKNKLGMSLIGTFLMVHLYLWGWVIAPVYAQPPIITQQEIPQERQLRVDMGLGLTLVGAELIDGAQGVVLGETAELVLYWEKTSDTATDERPELVIDILGRELTPLGKQQTYHGGGIYPADLWPLEEPGQQIVVERLFIPTFRPEGLDESADLPVEARVLVKLAGQEPVVDIGGVKIIPQIWPKQRTDNVAQLGEHIQLVDVTISGTAVSAGEAITVDVVWQTTGDVIQEYVTLVHLGVAGQPPVAQGDSWPVAGSYRTGLWRTGEQIRDQYEVVIPADTAVGEYRLLLGMYHANDPAFSRLPVWVEGVTQEENGLVIGLIKVQN